MDPAVTTESPLPGREAGATCSSRRRRVGTASRWTGWRGGEGSGTYMCAEDCDVLQVTGLRPQWSGGERSRRSESTFSTSSAGRGAGQAGGRGGEAGSRTCRAAGTGGVGGWAAARGAGCAGREPAGSHSVGGPHRGIQVTRRTRVGQYARLWWESQGTRVDRRGVLDVGRVR